MTDILVLLLVAGAMSVIVMELSLFLTDVFWYLFRFINKLLRSDDE